MPIKKSRTSVVFYPTKKFRALIKEMAQNNDRSISAEVIAALAQYYGVSPRGEEPDTKEKNND